MKFLKIIILLVAIILSSHHLQSQNTTFKINRSITMESEDSEIKIIPFTIKKGTSSISIMISSDIDSGNLTIEIYDSSNTKKGEFTTESIVPKGKTKALFSSDKKEMTLQEDNSINEVVSGHIQKYISNPEIGNWSIKIIPKKVTGKITTFVQFNLAD